MYHVPFKPVNAGKKEICLCFLWLFGPQPNFPPNIIIICEVVVVIPSRATRTERPLGRSSTNKGGREHEREKGSEVSVCKLKANVLSRLEQHASDREDKIVGPECCCQIIYAFWRREWKRQTLCKDDFGNERQPVRKGEACPFCNIFLIYSAWTETWEANLFMCVWHKQMKACYQVWRLFTFD